MSESLYLEGNKNLFLKFSLGNTDYAVSADGVLEVMKLSALDYPQKLPNNIIGLLKYNNMFINVIDIRFYLNIKPTQYSVGSDIIILKTDESIFGIIADCIEDIETFDYTKLNRLPTVDANSIINMIYTGNRQNTSIIDIYSLENVLKNPVSMPEFDVKSLFPQGMNELEIMNKRKLNLFDKSNYSLAKTISLADKYISFLLNENQYCVKLDLVTEVIKETKVTKIPCTPDFIKGVMNLRGDFITVINLKHFLNLTPNSGTDNSSSIAVSNGEFKIAFAVDLIQEIIDIPEYLSVKSTDNQLVREIILDDKIYSIVNTDNLFTNTELFLLD